LSLTYDALEKKLKIDLRRKKPWAEDRFTEREKSFASPNTLPKKKPPENTHLTNRAKKRSAEQEPEKTKKIFLEEKRNALRSTAPETSTTTFAKELSREGEKAY